MKVAKLFRNLIENQQFINWKTYDLVCQSIKKWHNICYHFGEDRRAFNCSLCLEYQEVQQGNCWELCPLSVVMEEHCNDDSSVWKKWFSHNMEHYQYVYPDIDIVGDVNRVVPNCSICLELAEKMLFTLVMLNTLIFVGLSHHGKATAIERRTPPEMQKHHLCVAMELMMARMELMMARSEMDKVFCDTKKGR